MEKSVIVTCGDWDLRSCLRKEAFVKKIALPDYLKSWINIKKVFTTTAEPPKDSAHVAVSSMVEMLKIMGIPLAGKHHSGIDDAKNIASVAIKMLENGFKFKCEFINQV